MADGNRLQRMSPWNLAAAVAVGVSLGLGTQFLLSSQGRTTLVPPYSISVTLAGLAVLLVVLGLRLRRNMAKGTGAVNPFQAVRLLATARAGQLVGSLFAGLGGGLLLALAQRSVPAHYEIWLPMVATAITGIALVICALIAERMCQIPPGNDREGGEEGSGIASLEA